MTARMDEFGSLGDDFKGFPKHLPEDTVEYALFVIRSDSQSSSSVREELDKVLAASNSLVKQLLHEYIWQREAFELGFSNREGHLCLHGQTNYGDSIEDEWLIVYLLRELTKTFSDPWVKVSDADGEFLLVEAANALPQWLVPEVADNRVWMHQGKLLVIPISDSPSKTEKSVSRRPLSIDEALDSISTSPDSLLHLPELESEAFYRLRNYPKQISDSLHNALVTLPRNLACILKLRPEFISPAVEAFYLRDPISLRPLQEAKEGRSKLLFPPEDLVTVSVRFTKTGYAQLMSQPFVPPPAWSSVFANRDIEESSSRLEIGMKVACGFEMLIADPQNQEKDSVVQTRMILSAIAKGEICLPSDSQINAWDKRQDREDWLDIDFADLENELSRKAGDQEAKDGGFGDKNAQDNLRKLVQRFESFLNDETAGIDGVDESGDEESDSDDLSDSDAEHEGDVSFNEADFTKMMREMMGLPAETAPTEREGPTTQAQRSAAPDSDSEQEHEEDDIQEMMTRMEAELNEAGALDLDPTPRKIAAVQRLPEAGPSVSRGSGSRDIVRRKADSTEQEDEDEEEEEEQVDIDYNLAKNILESFKTQSGLPGPGGNLLASLGIRLPRDESERETGSKTET